MNMAFLISLLTGANMAEPMLIALIEALKADSGKTDEEVIADARAKVQETDQITSDDMTDKP